MNIPEEAQVAAREAVNAWFDRVNHPALDIIGDAEVQDIARAALSAAAPLIAAQAWDIGYEHGRVDGLSPMSTNNPFKEQA